LPELTTPTSSKHEPGPEQRRKVGHLVSGYESASPARQAAKEYGFRFGCEGGFRDVKWIWDSRNPRQASTGLSRLFALFAIALIALTTLAIKLFVRNGNTAQLLLRRVTSRRRKRCELSLVAAIIALIQQDPSFLNSLSINTKFKLLYDS
jgi:hypothetical protein